MLALAALAVGVPVALLFWWAEERGANSEDEGGTVPQASTSGTSRLVSAVMDALGWRYWFGAGSPSTPWEDGPDGVDCNGFVQMALVKLGILEPDETDRGTAAMADWCVPVAVGEQRPGDIAYYPGHTMLVVSEPGADGHSMVMGASGGTSTTFGDNPSACVKLFSSALYRGSYDDGDSDGFVTYMRPPTGNPLAGVA